MLFTRDLSADALSNPSAGCGEGCGGVCGGSAATTGAFSCGCGLGLEGVVVGGIGQEYLSAHFSNGVYGRIVSGTEVVGGICRTVEQDLEMADCCLALIEQGTFHRRQTERVRMLLKRIPQDGRSDERFMALVARLRKVEDEEVR